MSAKISAGRDGAAQSIVSHRAARASPVKRSLSPEATGITERSPKRAAVSELKSFSDGISGRSSPRQVSEMPVLTRVCSPATLPRLKKFRFHPIDGCFHDVSTDIVHMYKDVLSAAAASVTCYYKLPYPSSCVNRHYSLGKQ